MEKAVHLLERTEAILHQAEEHLAKLKSLEFEVTANRAGEVLDRLNSVRQEINTQKMVLIRCLAKLGNKIVQRLYDFRPKGGSCYTFELKDSGRVAITVAGGKLYDTEFVRSEMWSYDLCREVLRVVGGHLKLVPPSQHEEIEELLKIKEEFSRLPW